MSADWRVVVLPESALMAGKGAEKRLWELFIKNTALC